MKRLAAILLLVLALAACQPQKPKGAPEGSKLYISKVSPHDGGAKEAK